MEKQDIENNDNNETVIQTEETIKKRRGCKGGIRSEASRWRYKEDGTYDNRPIACNAYFNAYMCKKVLCPSCGKTVAYGFLKRHLKTKKCAHDSGTDEHIIKAKQEEIINLINLIKRENTLDTIIKKCKADKN
jgi:hypothetical protein